MPAAEDAVLRLVLRVSFPARALSALSPLGLAARRSGDDIVLDAPALAGLDVRLV